MSRDNILRRAAINLLAHVESTMPATHREWSRAMRAELDHIDGSLDALRWALGCLLVCYQQRMRLMNRTQLQVSNWVMGLESLLCFGPLTLLWLVSVANLGRLSSEPKTLVEVAFATAAPIGLLFGLRFALFRKVPSRIVALGLTGSFLLIGTKFFANAIQNPNASGSPIDWGLLALLSALPALCCWHLSIQKN